MSLVLFSGLLVGCAHFTPLPLPNQSEVMAPADMARVRVAANSIRHPLLPPIHFDDRDGISPDEAAVLAVLLNPDLCAARDERGIAAAQLIQAGLLPNPSLNASWETPNHGSTADTVDGFGVGLEWDVRNLITRTAHRRQSAAHAEAVDLEIAWREWQTAEAARRAVYHLTFARRRVDLAREMVKELHAQTLLVTRAVGLGQKTQLDAAAAGAAEREARTLLVDAEHGVVAARLALNHLLGVPTEVRLRVVDNIAVHTHLDILPRDTLLLNLENRRLDLLALRRGYESRNARLRAAILNQFPRVRIGLTQAKGTDALESLSVGLSIELPVFDRGQVRVQIERATRKKLRDEYAARVFNAVSRIDEILAEIQMIEDRIVAGSDAVASLGKLRSACTDAVRNGRMDMLRATAVTARYLQRQLEIIALRQQVLDARTALQVLSGLYHVTRQTSESARLSTGTTPATAKHKPTATSNPSDPSDQSDRSD